MAGPQQDHEASQWTGHGQDHDRANRSAARLQWRHAGTGGVALGAIGADHWVVGLVIVSLYAALWLLLGRRWKAPN